MFMESRNLNKDWGILKEIEQDEIIANDDYGDAGLEDTSLDPCLVMQDLRVAELYPCLPISK